MQGQTAYLIDGYNLLHRVEGLAGLLAEDPAAARTLLYKELLRLPRVSAPQLRVVIDGARLPDEIVPPELAVHWTRAPESADQRILKLLLREVRRQKVPRPWIVVSDDRDLIARARERGARAMACLAFLEQAGFGEAPPSPPPTAGRGPGPAADGVRIRKAGGRMSEAEQAWWLKTYGLSAEEAGVAAPPSGHPGTAAGAAADAQAAPPSRPPANRPTGSSGAGPEEDARYLRLLGVRPDDPRILSHEDEDWPEDGDPAAPR
jgi:predicted RNA-binding protein with PIN domain